ncbi:MAG: ribonuclease III [Desulfotomaculales bacterium]
MAGYDEALARLERALGFPFHNRELLSHALTHGSFAAERHLSPVQNNQRLEFLGDAVLELVISEHLFRQYPDREEGDLTRMRAAVVCEPSLVRAARALDLGSALRLGRGEERDGGRERPSILADAFEALLGAVYLDRGLDAARRVALTWLAPVLAEVAAGGAERDYKTRLQEALQARGLEPVEYAIVGEEGPDHAKTFTVATTWRGRRLTRGTGRSKKEAEQEAARALLELLEDEGYGVLEPA